MSVLGAVPIKPFESSKQRLAGALPLPARVAVSQEMARRTLQCVAEAGADPLVLAADDEVAAWATAGGWLVLVDEGGDLNSASGAAVARASVSPQPWLIIHADLPLLAPSALTPAVRAISAGGSVIAPSRDGGTTLIGSTRSTFRFAYGPFSFRIHLHRMNSMDPLVLVDPRLAIDLDDPSDLAFAATRVGWLARLLDTLPRL